MNIKTALDLLRSPADYTPTNVAPDAAFWWYFGFVALILSLGVVCFRHA